MVHSRNSLLWALVITTAVVTAALSWAGVRLLSQQRDIDKQRAQQQLGTTAEAMAAAIRGKLGGQADRSQGSVKFVSDDSATYWRGGRRCEMSATCAAMISSWS